MTTPKHLGRSGGGSAPICNGGSVALRRAGLSVVEFRAVPIGERCARCNAKFHDDTTTRNKGKRMNAALAGRVRALDTTITLIERVTGRHDAMTTRSNEKLFVYDALGEVRAMVYDFHDAAAFVALVGAGGEVRIGRSKTRVLWREGRELDSAAQSYDKAADLMARRHDEMTP
jgi:hypothetical protein